MKMSLLLKALTLVALHQVQLSLGFIQTNEFFPYGPSAGDFRVPTADDNFVNVTIKPGFFFKFFQNTYYELFVNNNGGLSFRQGVSTFTPTCGALNTPMIIPYWADVNTILGGNVYYRQSTDAILIQKAKIEVQRAFPNLSTQNFRWLFIATWVDAPFFGASNNCSGLSRRNTFQTTLVTDGNMSFAMFYYNNLTWTTGTASGGNCFGQGGTPAKAGFDVGDGRTFYTIQGSCTPSVQQIASTSNVNQPGKWIFRIDQGFSDPAGNNTTSTTTDRPNNTTTVVYVGNTTTTTVSPINGECDPTKCELEGHCFEYRFCDPMTRQYRNFMCSEGLFWNPHNKPTNINRTTVYSTTMRVPTNTSSGTFYTTTAYPPAAAPLTSTGYPYMATGRILFMNSTNSSNISMPDLPEECHGSCDVWENLNPETKALYMADQQCFPSCFYAPHGECDPRYYFHGHNTEIRNIETIRCPIDTRRGMNIPMVWVQERESCDFCYNAFHSNSNSSSATPCCYKYDHDLVPLHGNDSMSSVPVIAAGRSLTLDKTSSHIDLGHSFDLKQKISTKKLKF